MLFNSFINNWDDGVQSIAIKFADGAKLGMNILRMV